MIFITLGTQDKSFKRLLEEIDKQINLGNITEEVIVQAGYTDYESNNMKIFKMIPMEEFDKYIKECDLLITHAGVGSIMSGLINDKKVIAAARLKKYNEHTNDHQLDIASSFSKEGYILTTNIDDLDKILKEVKTFKPKKFKSNNKNFIKIIEDFIDNN